MGKTYNNPGIVNLSKVSKNYESTSKNKGDSSHNTLYSPSENHRLSYDKKSDGSISKVHSTNQNNGNHVNYKDARY